MEHGSRVKRKLKERRLVSGEELADVSSGGSGELKIMAGVASKQNLLLQHRCW